MKRNFLLLIFAVSGATALIYEILWIRPLSLVFGNSIYAIGTIIFSFIIGLAIGSFLIAKYADKVKNPLQGFAYIQILVGITSIMILSVINELPQMYIGLYDATKFSTELFIVLQVVLSSLVLLIPATLIGMSFPLVMKHYSKNLSDIGKDVGKVDGVNSLGAGIGVLLVSFLLMPELGIKSTVQLTASINIVIGIMLCLSIKLLDKRKIAIISAIGLLVIVGTADYDTSTLNIAVFAIKNHLVDDLETVVAQESIIYQKDSFYQSILVVERLDQQNRPMKVLKLDGLPQCNTSPRVESGLYRLSDIPLRTSMHNYDRDFVLDSKILNIGLGCGTTSHYLDNRGYNVTSLEIDEYVVEASKVIYPEINDEQIIIDDARNWLLRNDAKFDFVITEPNQPYANNIGNLYTIEMWQLIKSRLSDNGIIAQWYPYWAMPQYEADVFLNTFKTVFPYTLAYEMEVGSVSQVILIGSLTPIEPDLKIDGLMPIDWDRLESLELPLNTDDRPVVEFSSAYKLFEDGN